MFFWGGVCCGAWASQFLKLIQYYFLCKSSGTQQWFILFAVKMDKDYLFPGPTNR